MEGARRGLGHRTGEGIGAVDQHGRRTRESDGNRFVDFNQSNENVQLRVRPGKDVEAVDDQRCIRAGLSGLNFYEHGAPLFRPTRRRLPDGSSTENSYMPHG